MQVLVALNIVIILSCFRSQKDHQIRGGCGQVIGTVTRGSVDFTQQVC